MIVENMIIRRMRQEDIKQVSRIEKDSFSVPWSENAFLKAMEDEHSLYLVAEQEDTILGMCGVRNILGEGEITNVAVDANARGRGIGRRLMEELLKKGEDLGIQCYTLEVRGSNQPAVQLYQSIGFVVEGVRKNFYERPIEDGLIMWKR